MMLTCQSLLTRVFFFSSYMHVVLFIIIFADCKINIIHFVYSNVYYGM